MQLKDSFLLQNGKYRIIRVLGQGGFGITYLAENTFFDKLVAIKEFFPKDFCGRDNTSHLILGTQSNAEIVEKLKARFLKEAKNIAKLNHPGIIKIYDVFEENNTAYYVMDYIEGENLNELVKRNGPLSESKALDYIRKVGDSLDYIHSCNMTHFDLKPANIMVRRSDNQSVLIDFGLSRQYDFHGDATSTFMQGVSHGYSPIEMYNVGAIQSWSPETDVYSLAATMFYLITGTVPPNACSLRDNQELLYFPPTVSKSVRSGIINILTVTRAQRAKTVQKFVESLLQCNDTYDESTHIINTDRSGILSNSLPRKSKNNNQKLSIIGKGIMVFGLIIILIGIGIWLYYDNELFLFEINPDNQILPIPTVPK